jgi:hypothetical protein
LEATPKVAHDVVHQLNFVEVEAPQMGTNVWTQDKKRIWLANVRINDLTGSCVVAMREKAVLQLAGLDPEDEQAPKKFAEMMELGHVQFPLLCSIRINVVARVNKDSSLSQGDGQGEINKVIVEAVEQDLAASPNSAYLELLAFVNQCPHEAEGIVPARLDAIKSTSHYPLQIDFGDIIRPCTKALVLIEITERTQSEKIGDNANRLITKNVKDILAPNAAETYNLLTMCDDNKLHTAILTLPRTGTRKQVAFAVVTGITTPGTFLVESVQSVAQWDVDATLRSFQKLLALGRQARPKGLTKRPTWSEDSNPVVAAKKCKILCAHPTDASLPDLLET